MNLANLNNNKKTGLFYFKSGCVFFWACWFSLAFTSNLFDFLHALNLLPNDIIFLSGNYLLLKKALSNFTASTTFLNVLFISDITVQGLSAILFFLTFFLLWLRKKAWFLINISFAISMALWATFLIFEELFLAYKYESVHIGLFVFELMTLMAIHLLPSEEI